MYKAVVRDGTDRILSIPRNSSGLEIFSELRALSKSELRALSSSELDQLADYARDELRNHLRAFEG